MSITPAMPHDNVAYRIEVPYENDSQCFMLKERTFRCQYAHIYASRLMQEREFLEKTARTKWGDVIPIMKLSELQYNERCIIIGTVFKQMVYKPSILRELSEENHLEPQPFKERYTDSSDCLILEDEVQRIFLIGNVDITFAVTGVVVAVLGTQDTSSGKFIVEEISYKVLPAQDPMPIIEDDKYILFISGMEIGGGNETEKNDIDQHLFQLQLMCDMVNGSLGDENIQKKMSNVCRVIIAGNSLSSNAIDKEGIMNNRGKKHQSSMQAKEDEKDARDAIKNLDDLLFQMAINCDVDVMPGPNDPTTYALPQKSLHPCLFPRSSPLSTLHLVPNPYRCDVSGFRLLGCSGQAIRDITRITEYNNHLEVLKKTLLFGHMAPTAPDTLGCYPFSGGDPFTIAFCPHVYFSGNSPTFEWKHFTTENGQKVILITIPVFRSSKMAVLLNLKTFECEALSFE